MTFSPLHSTNGNTFTLTLKGEPHLYPADKEGKRRAIVDGLHSIATLTVDADTYLPSNEALQIVAAVLYPGGIQTEADYQRVCQVTEKACAHIGYGPEVELGPPLVAFSQRGAYRKRYPPVEAHLVLAELALAGAGSTTPQQEMTCTVLWNRNGWQVFGSHWSQLGQAQQAAIQQQVDSIAEAAGWQKDTEGQKYTRPLAVNAEGARSHLQQLLRQENGRPVSVSSIVYQAQLGAYGRRFYTDDLTPALIPG